MTKRETWEYNHFEYLRTPIYHFSTEKWLTSFSRTQCNKREKEKRTLSRHLDIAHVATQNYGNDAEGIGEFHFQDAYHGLPAYSSFHKYNLVDVFNVFSW